MVPVPSKNIPWARRYSSSKSDTFRKNPENPRSFDSRIRKSYVGTDQKCSNVFLTLKKSEAQFFPSYSRPSEVVGTSYLVGLVLHTCFSKKKFVGWNFSVFVRIFDGFLPLAHVPKLQRRCYGLKYQLFLWWYTHTKKPIIIRKNIKHENFQPTKKNYIKQVYKIKPTKYEVPTTSEGRE